jgi:hypothetical protein
MPSLGFTPAGVRSMTVIERSTIHFKNFYKDFNSGFRCFIYTHPKSSTDGNRILKVKLHKTFGKMTYASLTVNPIYIIKPYLCSSTWGLTKREMRTIEKTFASNTSFVSSLSNLGPINEGPTNNQ